MCLTGETDLIPRLRFVSNILRNFLDDGSHSQFTGPAVTVTNINIDACQLDMKRAAAVIRFEAY